MKILIDESQSKKLFNLLENTNLSYLTFQNQDTEVYKKILSGIGAPITTETLAFMYAWRQGESSLAEEERFYCNNPFSTTWDTDQKGIKKGEQNSTMYTKTNSHGVKSYKSIDTGIYATIKTILKNFSGIAQALKMRNVNCYQIAEQCSSDLDKWGTTGNAVKSICKGYMSGRKPAPRPINREQGCY